MLKGFCYVFSEFAFPSEANPFRHLTLRENQGAYLLGTNQDGTALFNVPVVGTFFYFIRRNL